MPRISIFLFEQAVDDKILPRTGLNNVFLQPQPDINSTNPSSKTSDADSVMLSESVTSPGVYYADISKAYPRYDLYIQGVKDADFSGTQGFNLPSSKSIFFKRNVEINSSAYQTPEDFVVGVDKLATPDGGQTWPKFSALNIPLILIQPPSELISDYYVFRLAKIVRDSIAVDVVGILSFKISLDPNGPELPNYYVDMLFIMP